MSSQVTLRVQKTVSLIRRTFGRELLKPTELDNDTRIKKISQITFLIFRLVHSNTFCTFIIQLLQGYFNTTTSN